MARSRAFWSRLPTALPCAWPCSLSWLRPARKPKMREDRPMLLIKNGRVIDPASGTDAKRNIWIEGERIARIPPAESPKDSSPAPNGGTIDAAGGVVAPGFIHLHCYGREPGGESPETIESG